MKFALVGKNIDYSLSPILHKVILESINVEGEYTILSIEESELKSTLDRVRSGEFKGLNITTPYKERVIEYLDALDEIALKCGAVNTVVMENGELIGYNSDYFGVAESFYKYGVDVSGKKCYILGSGGSSRTVRFLMENWGGEVFTVSRGNGDMDYETFKALKEELLVVVNATPLTFKELLGDNKLKIDNYFDLKYFNRMDTIEVGEFNFDGLYMLFAQGVASQEIWLDREINIDGLFLKFMDKRLESDILSMLG